MKEIITDVALVLYKDGENVTKKQAKSITKLFESILKKNTKYNNETDYTLSNIELYIKELLEN